jgi:hypothetical protein
MYFCDIKSRQSVSQSVRQTDRQTDRRADNQIDSSAVVRQMNIIIIINLYLPRVNTKYLTDNIQFEIMVILDFGYENLVFDTDTGSK